MAPVLSSEEEVALAGKVAKYGALMATAMKQVRGRRRVRCRVGCCRLAVGTRAVRRARAQAAENARGDDVLVTNERALVVNSDTSTLWNFRRRVLSEAMAAWCGRAGGARCFCV